MKSNCQRSSNQGGKLFQCSITKSTFLVLAGFLIFALPVHADQTSAIGVQCTIWPAWNSFSNKFVSADGRVIDRSIPQKVTTSEGQAYALMFALIANDRTSFDQLVRWTENNLANGDLTSRLPAWQWGQRQDESWGVIDDNAASDADLWIAYALNEAGQHWNIPRYAALAELLVARILREETADIPGLGITLLPGPMGFQLDEISWRLNPSYSPIQIMRRFDTLYPKSGWDKLIKSSIEVITMPSPQGFVPEWVDYLVGTGFQSDHDPAIVGVGFNAIRVYLWAGMLDKDDDAYQLLLDKLAPMAHSVAEKGFAGGKPSAGFSSALLPFLKASGLEDALHLQRQRIVAFNPMERDDNYYDQVLTLFGLGWQEGYYKFGRNGQLIPRWECAES